MAHARVLALAGAVCLALPGAALAQTDPYVPPAEEMAEARVIIDAMFPADKREEIILDIGLSMADQVAASYMTGPAFEEPGIKALMDRYLEELPETFKPLYAKHLPKIFEATAIAYTREFTLGELKDISAFARTPSGQRYFMALYKFTADPAVAAVTQAMLADLAPIQQDMVARLRREIEAYLVANPEVLERLSQSGAGQ